MNLDTGSRTIQISTAFITQLIEEKIEQFGFKPDDDIIKITLVGLPKNLLMKVKSKKVKEVHFIHHNGT